MSTTASVRRLTPLTQVLGEGTISRAELKQFMRRTNKDAAWRLMWWCALLFSTGTLVWLTLGSTWMWPAMFVHGIVLVHNFSLQHECVHYTAFKTRWVNDLVGALCGVSIALAPRFFRYEHCDHHTYTQRVGQDPEMLVLPRSIWGYLWYLSSIPYWRAKVQELARHALGILDAGDRVFVPDVEHKAIIFEARVLVMLYLAIIAAMAAFDWWLPLWLWFVPVLLGEPVMRFIRMTEHVGCEQVSDMRTNTRTNLVHPISRFLCWNMNYHAEHHYAASVPFHALPALHERLKGTLKVEPGGYVGAHRDMLNQMYGAGNSSNVAMGTINTRDQSPDTSNDNRPS